MIFDELNTVFRWYNSLSKQNRYKGQCAAVCDFTLISPCNDMLPFQIRQDSFGTPTSWTLVYLGDPITIPAISAKAVFCLTDTATAFSIDVNGYGTIATSAMLGTIELTVDSLVSQINLGGVFTSFGHDNCVYVIAPAGEAWNGVVTTFGITYGMIAVSTNGEFSGASDETTGNTIDITTCIPYLNTYEADGKFYIQYTGGSLPGCLPQQMDCGEWYSIISDGAVDLYSEVFEVIDITDLDFEQSILPLFSLWRWYDSIDKQTRYKEYCSAVCDFSLLSSNTQLLPFQIANPLTVPNIIVSNVQPTSLTWVIVSGSATILYVLQDYLGAAKFIATALWNTDIDTTMADLVVSMNTNTDDDPLDTSGVKAFWGATFDNSAGYAASYVAGTNTLTVVAPPNIGATINNTSGFFAGYGGAGIVLNPIPSNRLWAGGVTGQSQYPIIQSWKLVSIDGDCEYLLPIADLDIVNTSSHGYRIIYDGNDIDLPCGEFYSVLDDGITTWYSEVIEITNAFSLATEDYLQTDDGINLTDDSGNVLTID